MSLHSDLCPLFLPQAKKPETDYYKNCAPKSNASTFVCASTYWQREGMHLQLQCGLSYSRIPSIFLAINVISPGIQGLVAQVAQVRDLDLFHGFIMLHQYRVDRERGNK